VKDIIQRGLYFEDLDIDVVYRHSPGRTVEAYDNTLFSTMTMNPQSLHLNAHAAEDTQFGQRLVNSMFTLSTLIGLSVGQLTQQTTVANLGFEHVAFPKPVFAGDTLYAETTVVGKRESKSRPDVGIVTFLHIARNQHGDNVAEARRNAMMHRRPAAR
jgi:acyl dehydratase